MGLEGSYEVILCKALPEMVWPRGKKAYRREPGFMIQLFYLSVALVKSFNVSELHFFYL